MAGSGSPSIPLQIPIRIHFGPVPDFTFSICLRKGGSEDPDPLFPNVDPRIRIHVKMRWIPNASKILASALLDLKIVLTPKSIFYGLRSRYIINIRLGRLNPGVDAGKVIVSVMAGSGLVNTPPAQVTFYSGLLQQRSNAKI